MLPTTAVEYPAGVQTREFDLKEAVRCIEKQSKYEITGAEIHKGSYGRVYGLCQVRQGKCVPKKKVVKIILLQPGDLEKMQTDDIQRELHIFDRLNDSGFTPKIYDSFGCGNYLNIVLERFGRNMTQIGHQQALGQQKLIQASIKLPPTVKWNSTYSLLYTDGQMRRMFQIAADLGKKYGVIHGDLGPNQYLLSQDGQRVVVTDFGFSGTSTVEPGKWHAKWGWHHIQDCKAVFSLLPPREYDSSKHKQQLYRDYFNLWQLWFFFGFFSWPTFIVSGGGLTVFPHHTLFPESSPYRVPEEAFLLFVNQAKCDAGFISPHPLANVFQSQLPMWSG